MALIKGFFFDLDGTLVDTHKSNYLAYSHAINDILSVRVDEKLDMYIRSGDSSDVFLRKLIPGIGDSELDSVNSRKKELYPSYLSESNLNNYLADFLNQMSNYYITALVTTAKRKNAMSVIKEHKLENYFNFMIFGEDVLSMKPSPDAYLLALEKSGLTADEVVAFEDSQKGIDAAEAAGIKTIHVRNFIK